MSSADVDRLTTKLGPIDSRAMDLFKLLKPG